MGQSSGTYHLRVMAEELEELNLRMRDARPHEVALAQSVLVVRRLIREADPIFDLRTATVVDIIGLILGPASRPKRRHCFVAHRARVLVVEALTGA